MAKTEISQDRLLQLVASHTDAMTAAAVEAHRANWQGVQAKVAATTSCMDVLEMGEVTRRLRKMLRQMVNELRMARMPQVVSANDTRVIALASSRAWMLRDIDAVWALYRDMMGDYRAMYDAYMFHLDLPSAVTWRPLPPLAE